jgi:hypothetical protein
MPAWQAAWYASNAFPLQKSSPVHDAVLDAVHRVESPSESPPDGEFKGLQRRWSIAIDAAQQLLLLSSIPPASAARVRAAAAPYSACWILPTVPDGFDGGCLSPAEFVTLVRFRLGLPLCAASSPCTFCAGRSVADVQGDHSLLCMCGGARIRLSNAVRDSVAALLRNAGFALRIEARPFGLDPGARIDILAFPPGGRRSVALDIAVTHAHRGDPSAYEGVKFARYGALAAAEGDIDLVPLVVDTFGGWGTSALPFLRAAARRAGFRADVLPARAVPEFLGRVGVTLARGIARILLANAAFSPSSVDFVHSANAADPAADAGLGE